MALEFVRRFCRKAAFAFAFIFSVFVSYSAVGSPGAKSEAIYDVTTYGAVGNGKTMCTRAIQTAIDSCSDEGGGRVLVPRGRFITGSLTLKSGVDLCLQSGATLVGSSRLADYTSGVLIFAENCKHVSISGKGIVDGNGRVFWDSGRHPIVRPDGMIKFQDCKDVTVRGIRITNSPKFTIAFHSCSNVLVRNIYLKSSLDSPNTDGVDVVNSSDVLITDSYMETGDDAVCLKSTRSSGMVARVHVSNCTLISDDTALKLGTGSKDKISDCTFTNITIPECTNGIGLFMKDGGIFERIRFSGIDMESVIIPLKKYFPRDGGAKYWRKVLRKRQTFPIFVDSESRRKDSPVGTIRDIEFKNITIRTRGGNCLIQGRAERYLENISLDNVSMDVLTEENYDGRTKPRGTRTMAGRAPNDFAFVPSYFTFAYADNLALKDVSVKVENAARRFRMYCVWGKSIRGCKINGIFLNESDSTEGFPLMKFIGSRGVSVTGCVEPSARKVLYETGAASNVACRKDSAATL